jgi:hypothetical protein
LRLKDLEDKVLFAEAGGAGNVEAASKFAQFGDIVLFKFRDCHGLPEYWGFSEVGFWGIEEGVCLAGRA